MPLQCLLILLMMHFRANNQSISKASTASGNSTGREVLKISLTVLRIQAMMYLLGMKSLFRQFGSARDIACLITTQAHSQEHLAVQEAVFRQLTILCRKSVFIAEASTLARIGMAEMYSSISVRAKLLLKFG